MGEESAQEDASEAVGYSISALGISSALVQIGPIFANAPVELAVGFGNTVVVRGRLMT